MLGWERKEAVLSKTCTQNIDDEADGNKDKIALIPQKL